jgi:hypothetical protein
MNSKIRYKVAGWLMLLLLWTGISYESISQELAYSSTCTTTMPLGVKTVVDYSIQAFNGTCSANNEVVVRITNPVVPAPFPLSLDILTVKLTSDNAGYAKIFLYDNDGSLGFPLITTRPTSTFTNLPNGNYVLQITYQRSLFPYKSSISAFCQVNTFTITKTCTGITATCTTTANETCTIRNNGSIVYNIQGGQGPYKYSFSNGVTIPNTNATSETISN